MSVNKIQSRVEYENKYRESVENPEKFWSEIAENFTWHRKWDNVLSWEFITPHIEWFKGGKLNITENLLDRYADKQPDKTALIWEPNDPTEEVRTYTYQDLKKEVCKFANVLRNKGIKKGDRVCLYLSLIHI